MSCADSLKLSSDPRPQMIANPASEFPKGRRLYRNLPRCGQMSQSQAPGQMSQSQAPESGRIEPASGVYLLESLLLDS